MRVIYVHETPSEVPSKSIFLAGPSPRGQDHYNWRPEALKILENIGFDGVVFVPLPRDGQWAPNFDAQVEWELTYLEESSIIVFWVPRKLDTLPAFTTNVEFGMYVKSGKIILGFPEGAPKMRYLAYIGKKNGVPVYHTLVETLRVAVNRF